MREEHIGLIGQQILRGDLLDAQNHITVGEILLDSRPTLHVLLLGEDAQVGGLYHELDFGVVGGDVLHVVGGEDGAPLPAALVLSADSHFERLLGWLHTEELIIYASVHNWA